MEENTEMFSEKLLGIDEKKDQNLDEQSRCATILHNIASGEFYVHISCLAVVTQSAMGKSNSNAAESTRTREDEFERL